MNSELEQFVAVNPTDSDNIIGVYQQDRYTFGGARGLGAAVSHDGGATWSATHPHFSLCAGGTAANGGDFQRSSDPWVTFSPNGAAYFISLSVSFIGPVSATGTGVLHCHPSTDCTDPANWAENHVAGPFDTENAPLAGGYFLGDYEGLDSIGTTFTSFFPDDCDGQGQHLPGEDLALTVLISRPRSSDRGRRLPMG